MRTFSQKRQSEAGNVLFLILIAVALFAALSYAVTQSTRSGGGSADRETSILNSASMTQYPASLRTSLVRMVLAGTNVTEIKFNSPANFPSVDEDELVFHPRGGGAVYQVAPDDLIVGSASGEWTFNANFNIPQIGIDDESDGNDIIAFLPGIAQNICERVNTELSIDTSGCTTTIGDIPDLDSAADNTDIDNLMDESYNFATETGSGNTSTIQGQSCTSFTGQPSGCFNDTTGTRFVFYSVLLER